MGKLWYKVSLLHYPFISLMSSCLVIESSLDLLSYYTTIESKRFLKIENQRCTFHKKSTLYLLQCMAKVMKLLAAFH